MQMTRLDVDVAGNRPSRGINSVTCMFIFSLSIGIVALVLGGVAISRTNSPAVAVPSITNNFPVSPIPAPVPTPVPTPVPSPSNSTPTPPGPAPPPQQPPFVLTGQQSLLVRNSNSGSQSALYFLTFYQNDATCSRAGLLYDPVADILNIGL
jgi:hypothetical protein